MGSDTAACQFCGESPFIQHFARGCEYTFYQCPYCGKYGITRGVQEEMDNDILLKQRLGMLLIERRLTGYPAVILSVDFTGERDGHVWMTFREFLHGFPRPDEVIDRVLLNLSNMVSYITDPISIHLEDKYVFFARDSEGMAYIIRQLHELGFTNAVSGFPGNLRIATKGWDRISSINKGLVTTRQQAFTAMWFDPSMQTFYDDGIKLAVEADGVTKCIRIDTVEHNNDICDEIIKEIRNSRYVIADFTGNRGGVYFEAGYALGIGLPVIYTVRADYLDQIHFDTEHYNHIVYETPNELLEKLRNRIGATII